MNFQSSRRRRSDRAARLGWALCARLPRSARTRPFRLAVQNRPAAGARTTGPRQGVLDATRGERLRDRGRKPHGTGPAGPGARPCTHKRSDGLNRVTIASARASRRLRSQPWQITHEFVSSRRGQATDSGRHHGIAASSRRERHGGTQKSRPKAALYQLR
jgi:hypothetical protein